jgi:hypothetical protein
MAAARQGNAKQDESDYLPANAQRVHSFYCVMKVEAIILR